MPTYTTNIDNDKKIAPFRPKYSSRLEQYDTVQNQSPLSTNKKEELINNVVTGSSDNFKGDFLDKMLNDQNVYKNMGAVSKPLSIPA